MKVESYYEICRSFPVTQNEYNILSKKFGGLVVFSAKDFLSRNARNLHINEREDIMQNALCALIKATSYCKRQIYVLNCIEIGKKYVKNSFVKKILMSLEELWHDRKKHGANNQIFGKHQEDILETIIQVYIPSSKKPDKTKELNFDDMSFVPYLKSALWNSVKFEGKVIKRELKIRMGQVSIHDYDFLGI